MGFLTRSSLNPALALIAVLGITYALWNLHLGEADVTITPTTIGDTPATIFKPTGPMLGPVVIIAHGFAGSQQLMRSFALTFSRNGYLAVTYDLPGHGRNPRPLSGDIGSVDGATKLLVDETSRVAAFARSLGDGRLAVLGHSMASDIIVRFAQATRDITATIAVSMFSPAVTSDTPRNLLVIVGSLESFLTSQALQAVAMANPGSEVHAGVTYGDPANGTGRRAAVSANVEHIGVLYSRDSMAEALTWLDRSFSVERTMPSRLDRSGPMILLLLASLVVLARPLSSLLPRVDSQSVKIGLPWGPACLGMIIPAVLTPPILRIVPTHFLPVVVGDYLAVHFATYGMITLICLGWIHRRKVSAWTLGVPSRAMVLTTAGYIFYTIGVLGYTINAFVTSFVAIQQRLPLILALLPGTLLFFLSDEWLTRGWGTQARLYFLSKIAFLGSLALAVGLDFERLFFLAIIIPVIIPLMLVYGLFSTWIYSRTANPVIAGIGNALAFAWAIGVTFPMLASS